MDHDSGYIDGCVVGMFAELALVFIDELLDKEFDVGLVGVGEVFGLLEEISCWILKFLHLNINII